jgi:hypothetical protein
MKRILALVTFLVVAVACTEPPPPNAPSSNANNATAKTPAAVSEADAIAREKATWEAIKKKDYDGFANMLATEYLEIGGDGVYDKPGIVGYLKDLTVADVTFADWKMLPIDKDALILTYNVTIKGTFKNEPIPAGPYRAGSAWVNRDGKWLAIYYQETLPVASPPPPPPASSSPAAKSSASPAASPAFVTAANPIANEIALWEAIKAKDYETFAALLAPDAVEVEATGVFDKAGTVQGVRSFDFAKIQLSDWKSVKFDNDAALVTYIVTTPGAKPAKEHHSTIWANRNGKWLAIYHHGTPIQGQAAAAKPTARTNK